MVDSQTHFLHQIPAGAEVLILGGGTGWLLEKISEQNKSCKILYVDLSAEMIRRARSRKTLDEVQFIQGTAQDIPKTLTFDVIITNFYLDLFSDQNLNSNLRHIQTRCKPQTLWFVSEFVETKRWHTWLLKLMYLFFKVACGIEGSGLPRWREALQAMGWRTRDQRFLFGGFINTSFWVR